MIRRHHSALLIAALTSVLLIACGGGGEEGAGAEAKGAGEDKADEGVTLVETATLNTTSFQEVIELNGETEPWRSAQLSSPVPGRITKLLVEEGEPVEGGESVLWVDVSTQRSQIDGLEIQIEQLDSDIKRTRKLIDKGLATKPQLEALETQRRSLKQSISQIKVGMRQARTKAPISGVITRKHLEEGEIVNPGVPVATIVDLSRIIVRVALPEHNIKYVLGERGDDEPAPRVLVRLEALDELIEGRVARVGLEANTRNRTFPVEIHIDNPDGYLRAGLRATGILERRSFEGVVVVPRDALLQALEGSEVLVVEDGKAVAKPVVTGPGYGRYVVITEGLEAGEELIVRGHRTLVHGEPVKISDNQPCCAEQLERYREKHFGTKLVPNKAAALNEPAEGEE